MSHEHDEESPAPLTLQEVTNHAKEHLLTYRSHIPVVIVEGEKQSIVVGIGDLPDTADMRVRHMFVVGYVVSQQEGADKQLRQLFFITEGWMSYAEEGALPDVPPSEDPNRHEALVILNLHIPDFQSQFAIIEMHRDDQGNLNGLNELKPPQIPEEHIESPLLLAFAAGYQAGIIGTTGEGDELNR